MANPLAFVTARIDRLSARERRLVTLLGGVFAFILLIGAPVAMTMLVYSRHSDNDDLRAALEAVQSARSSIHEHQAKKDLIASHYARRAPALAGLLAQIARDQKLELADSVDRPDVPRGKKYTERNTVVHLRKSGMLSVAKFLEGVEKSGYPVAVTRLDLRKRNGEPDSYDLEVGVSAYDRNESSSSNGSAGAGAGKTP
jgi:general secretion pathway protein M